MRFLRRYRVIRVAFLCLLALFGCEQAYKDEGVTGGGEEPVPLRLAGLFIKESGVSSRSGGVQPLTAGDIGIFRYASKGYSEIRSNVHYRYSGGKWSVPDAGGPIYLTKNPANLCAYYPYSSADDYADGVVTLTSRRYAQSADLCYQTGVTASNTSGPVSFTLNRAYAKWVFNFTRDASYTGTCAVSQIKIAHPDLVSSNTLNLITGEYGTPVSGSKGSVTITDVGIIGIASGGTQTVSVLMVPALPDASLSGDITLTFTVDGEEMTTTVNPSEAALAAGNQYVLNVTITPIQTVINTANCYIVVPGGNLKMPVNIKGNGGNVAGTGLSTTHTAGSVGILWQTEPGLIILRDFNISAQTVKITAGSSSGNAVIANYDGPNATGNILWSWHIWVTDYNPDSSPVANGNIYTYNNYIWMDRNLGATTATPANVNTLGLYYQWGRKDPFPGPSDYKDIPDSSYSSLPIYDASGTQLTEGAPTGGTGINSVVVSESNNLLNSIRKPMTFYYNNVNLPYDWLTNTSFHNPLLWGGGNTDTPTNKTIFDPCPPGWRVPAWRNGTSPWDGFTVDTFPWSNYGRIYTVANTYYPASGYRHRASGTFDYVERRGYCWSASVPKPSQQFYSLHFEYDRVSLTTAHYSANGFPVRCVREW